jgi:hypothetical protein
VPSQPPRGACGRGDQSPKIAERSGCSSADEQTGSGWINPSLPKEQARIDFALKEQR